MSKIEELEQMARFHTAEIAALQLMVRAVIAASPKESREGIRAAFRLMRADQEERLSDQGFALGVSSEQMRLLQAGIRQELEAFQKFLDG